MPNYVTAIILLLIAAALIISDLRDRWRLRRQIRQREREWAEQDHRALVRASEDEDGLLRPK